jgi:hypothetical protein
MDNTLLCAHPIRRYQSRRLSSWSTGGVSCSQFATCWHTCSMCWPSTWHCTFSYSLVQCCALTQPCKIQCTTLTWIWHKAGVYMLALFCHGHDDVHKLTYCDTFGRRLGAKFMTENSVAKYEHTCGIRNFQFNYGANPISVAAAMQSVVATLPAAQHAAPCVLPSTTPQTNILRTPATLPAVPTTPLTHTETLVSAEQESSVCDVRFDEQGRTRYIRNGPPAHSVFVMENMRTLAGNDKYSTFRGVLVYWHGNGQHAGWFNHIADYGARKPGIPSIYKDFSGIRQRFSDTQSKHAWHVCTSCMYVCVYMMRACMRVCMYVCMCLCAGVCECMHVHVSMMYVWVCVLVCVYMFWWVCARECMLVRVYHMCLCVSTCEWCMYVLYGCVCICMCACACVYMVNVCTCVRDVCMSVCTGMCVHVLMAMCTWMYACKCLSHVLCMYVCTYVWLNEYA